MSPTEVSLSRLPLRNCLGNLNDFGSPVSQIDVVQVEDSSIGLSSQNSGKYE